MNIKYHNVPSIESLTEEQIDYDIMNVFKSTASKKILTIAEFETFMNSDNLRESGESWGFQYSLRNKKSKHSHSVMSILSKKSEWNITLWSRVVRSIRKNVILVIPDKNSPELLVMHTIKCNYGENKTKHNSI